MTIPTETILVIALIAIVAIFAARILAWVIGLVVIGIAIILGLAIASDLVSGTHALQQIAAYITPIVASVIVAVLAWFRNHSQGGA